MSTLTATPTAPAAAIVASTGPVPMRSQSVHLTRRGRLLIMVLAVVYIISPIDLLPEAFLTLPGMLDDAGIAAWLIATATETRLKPFSLAPADSSAAPTVCDWSWIQDCSSRTPPQRPPARPAPAS